MEVVHELLSSIEKDMLQSFKDPRGLATLQCRLRSVLSVASGQLQAGAFDDDGSRALMEQVARIKHIASLFLALDLDEGRILDIAAKEAKDITKAYVGASRDRRYSNCRREKHQKAVPDMSQADSLNSKLLRQWFLDNLADPFPSKRTNGDLVDQTNALIEAVSPTTAKGPLSMKPIDTQQCSLWFVNSRRRSGWTDFHRRFAQSEKSIMVGIIDSLKPEEGAEQPGRNIHLESILEMNADGFKCSRVELASRVEQCREAYASMLDWLHQRKKDEIGDWMDEVIQEAKAELKAEKAAERLERKRIAKEREEEIEIRRQKRKASNESSSSESDAVGARLPLRSVRRRTVNKRSKGQPAKPSTINSTPDNFIDQGCSSKCPANLGNSDGSRRVPSLTDSEGSTSRSSSSSSSTSIASSASSLGVYPGTLEGQGSPTLRILRNSQPKDADQTMMTLPQGYGLQHPPLDCSASKPTDEAYSLTPVPLVLPDWLQVPTSEPNLRQIRRSEL